ncbi:RluA family pseudouridine synthase [Alkalicoccus chagannorensis]|uniref:RluA family pseudouridine synthase n=1 Tax=Alkalicoccus chagannorensis TaxID=427072 RepID=UPI000429824F|nr:RluA family pseudouridine synthase [Alkalicoccus chagannorensis]
MPNPNIPVIYEDNHLLVVDKPINIPVQEDASRDRDMLTMLKEDIKERYEKPGNVYLGLVHRLDRPVGGVMVFAKTSKAASRLSDAVRRHAFDKQYKAVVHGTPRQQEEVLTNYLYKDRQNNQVYVVDENHPEAKEARLKYCCLSKAEGYSLVDVDLYTGRPHQIRVQLAHAGTPIAGDQKYGSEVTEKGMQIALWASSLSFEHPVRREPLHFESRPPKTAPWHLFT